MSDNYLAILSDKRMSDMAKSKRLTIRLDEELGAVIDQACVEDNCTKTTAVLSYLKKGFGLEQEPKEQPREAVKGTWSEKNTSDSKPIPKATAIHYYLEDGTLDYTVYPPRTAENPGKNPLVVLHR